MTKQLEVKEHDDDNKQEMTHYYLILVRDPDADSDLPNRAF